MSSNMQRLYSGILMLGVVSGVAQQAEAARFGELHITRNTTLTDDQYGSVIFDADDITLDCAHKMVHISSYTKPNCYYPPGSGAQKRCAILADGRSNVTVKNCSIIGGFDVGLLFQNTTSSAVQTVSSNAKDGFVFEANQDIYVYDIGSSFSRRGVVVRNDERGWYELVSAVSSVYWGIWLLDSHWTRFYRPYVAFSGIIGFRSTDNTDVTLEQVYAETNSRAGFTSSGDTRLALTDGTYWRSGTDGLLVYETRDSLFQGNGVAYNGAECQTYQDETSTGNTWQGNSLQSWCGTVPDAH